MSQCRTPLSGIRTSRADGGLRASFAPASDAGTSSDQPSRWQELRKIAAQQDNLQSLAVAQSIVAGDLRSSSSHGLAPPVQTLLTPSRPSALGCGGSILDAATPSAGRASSSRLEDLVARHRSASLGVGGTHSGSGAAALRGSLSDDSSLGLEAHRLLQRAFVTAKTSETAAFMARPHSAGGGSDGELELQLAMTQIRSAFAAATLSSSSSAAAHPETPATLVAAGGRPSSAPGSAAGQRGRQAPPVASPALRASLSRTPLAAGAVSTPRGTSLAQQLQTKQAEAARVKELASKLRLLKLRRLLPAWRAAAAKLLHDRRVVQHAASQLRRRKAARLLLAWRRAAAASAADRRQRELAELTDARRKLQVAASFHCMFVAHLALRKWKSYARASRQFKQEQARQMAQAERAGEVRAGGRRGVAD